MNEAEREKLDGLITLFSEELADVDYWDGEYDFERSEISCIHAALRLMKSREKSGQLLLDVVIDGVRFVPVDSLAKES